MNDIIYRQDAIKQIIRWFNILIDDIKTLPDANPSKWTLYLCNEKLPNERGWYLGIFKETDTGWINPIPFICDYVGHKTAITTNDFWILKEHEDEREPGFDYYQGLECIAWTELPEPFDEWSDNG